MKNRLHQRHTKSVGRPIILSDDEEIIFREHILAVSDMGIPLSMYDLRCIVRQYLNSANRRVSVFKDNMPGWDWGEGFLRRHPTIKVCFGKNISRKRAQVDVDQLNQFYDNLEHEVADVPPQNIFNYDETGFHDNPKKKQIVIP